MRPKKQIILILTIALLMFLLTGCVPGDGKYSTDDPANFLSGIWHGWIAPFSLFVGLFKHNIRVYEVNNTGWWYDFGFYMAIISGFGGLSLSRKKNDKKKEK